MKSNIRIHVIACGVLAIDIKRIGQEAGLDLSFTFLEGGLHNKPNLLKQKLQEAIDRISAQGDCERIVIGYGLCGNGAVGITARNIPLVIPRVHDCIALFLGSDQAYKREFAKYPGTYYISAGWYEEKVQPHSQKQCGAFIADKTVTHDELVKSYGDENAGMIKDFVNSWQKNYQRAAFINTSAPGASTYESHAKQMAEAYGWKYEHIDGNCELLRKVLLASATTDDVLFIPPEHVTFYDASIGKINCGLQNQQTQKAQSHECTLHGSALNQEQEHSKLGLGIDAGGTYTDAAIYDFNSKQIIAKSKALTTKWNYSIGISEALEQLPREHLAHVDLVSVSTTLATNAIVEGHGSTVGLLVMPPYGLFEPADIGHEPKAVIRGKLEIDGEVLEPVDAEQVKKLAEEMVKQGVRAFAVSGYASIINPEHELEVKRIVKSVTGCSVTCGHELSEMLDFKTRASTAIVNARIIGRIEKFLREIKTTLSKFGMHVPVMVVKGDGTLMSDEVALQKPVETILSGPAASVAGARYLTGVKDAIVVDIGGTTTDTATVKDGNVRVHESGTQVGKHRTHVKALDMRTVGLGGDSNIELSERKIKIGPLRVGPVCWMAAKYPGAEDAVRYLENRIDNYRQSTAPAEFFVFTGQNESYKLNADEQAIVNALSERPYSADELANALRLPWYTMLRTEKLEEHHIIMRCGFTPTDILHVTGEFVRWNSGFAERMCDFFAKLVGTNTKTFVENIRQEIIRKLTVEILKKKLDEKTDPAGLDECKVCQTLLDNFFNSNGDGFKIGIKIDCPVIGVGAPAEYFIPEAARRLQTDAIIPVNADVANAIGAITSDILIRRSVRISVCESNFMIEGLPGARRFSNLQNAHDYAVEELVGLIRKSAHQAGTSSSNVRISYQDIIVPASNGMDVYLGREIRAELSGIPDVKPAFN